MSRLLGAAAGQLMRLKGGRRFQRKDVAPQSSATSALSARREACAMPRELVNPVLERFDKAALELKAVVGPLFEIDLERDARFVIVASPLEKVIFR
jgi:hypothetical protein